MDALRIRGGATLHGTVKVSGSKNAALPALAASLLCAGTHELSRVPDLADVKTLLGLLESMGCTFTRQGDVVRIEATKVDKLEAFASDAGPRLERLEEFVAAKGGW